MFLLVSVILLTGGEACEAGACVPGGVRSRGVRAWEACMPGEVGGMRAQGGCMHGGLG